jgi:hypothetical protein
MRVFNTPEDFYDYADTKPKNQVNVEVRGVKMSDLGRVERVLWNNKNIHLESL